MPEDEDEGDSEEFDLKEWKRKNEERRKERLKHASYGWAETVREAGELYRDLEQIEAVSEELDLSEDTAQEALAVYDLIFDQPTDNISARTAIGGRAYFSLERSIEDALGDEDGEKLEEVVREFVGAVYLQHDPESHTVDSPPKKNTPPSNVDFSKLREALSDNLTSEIQRMAIGSGISSIPDSVLESQTSRMADMLNPVIRDHNSLARDMAESINAQHRDIMQSAIAAGLPSILDHIQHQQNLMNASIANSIGDIQFPESVVADLASIQTSVNTTATAESTPATSDTEDSINTETPTTTVETDSPEVITTPTPETGPEGVTLDATLPDSDAFTTELVFEIPAMIVESILSTGQARTWFTNLSYDYQISVIRILLAAIAFQLTANLGMAALAALLAPAVRKAIIEE
ncbi:hypothetical protein [Halococcus sediminicola]|uniref:hypothetical protein n=1 Tax=Halococcus sediminicola TaxID=1264579 RepID=UPI000678A40D|nr:hypothetical protein [Halococcus sediminicola]